jgi:hypothetical protein
MIGLNCVLSFTTPMVKKNMKEHSRTVNFIMSDIMPLNYTTAQIMLIMMTKWTQMQRKLFTLHEVHLNVGLNNISCGFQHADFPLQ